jgi:DNA polymerase (family 10)
VLQREAYAYDMEKVFDAAAKRGVIMEANASSQRLDLKDTYLRMARDRGVKIVISTDAHSTRGLLAMRYGVLMARRGWIEKKDVVNTLPLEQFLAFLRVKPGAAKSAPVLDLAPAPPMKKKPRKTK